MKRSATIQSPKGNDRPTEEQNEEMDVKTAKTTNPKEAKKKAKRGVVYLSCIPQEMNVKRLREELENYGEVGNVFLQPDEKQKGHRYKQVFTEGWVEFFDKRVAKQVALRLNNTQVGGKKKKAWHADIWNIKYLPKFQWHHLNERLAYERAVYEQRLRAEISQIKKESSFHKENFRKSKIKEKEERRGKTGEATHAASPTIRLRDTEEEILTKKRRRAEEGEGEEGGKRKRQRGDRTKKSNHRPDGSHAVGALSLAANQSLLQTLFGAADKS